MLNCSLWATGHAVFAADNQSRVAAKDRVTVLDFCSLRDKLLQCNTVRNVEQCCSMDWCADLDCMAELGSFVPLVVGQQAVQNKGVGGYPSHHLSPIPPP